ncbi:MAG: radical SAM family heme chaperone HemW [Hyphomicrobiales bacterium]
MTFGVYVHWPFCKAKCPYCDFNSHVRHVAVDSLGFAEAIGTELVAMRALSGAREVTSVFFGGGTPSLMPPAAVAHVLDRIGALWNVAGDAEVTLEANPTSIEAENFRGYRGAGVNRVSVGVQALNDADLAALGRQHSAKEAIAAYRLAASIFPRTSFDLIYARPDQSRDAWRAELAQALAEQQGHMSLYQLTIEEGTAFADRHAKGTLVVPDEETAADLYEITQELTEAAGLSAYEVSNHARPGHECRHNLLYWRYGDYAGAGPGAHARLSTADGRRALVTEKHPETWRARVLSEGSAIIEDSPLDPEACETERLLMGLRLDEGIALDPSTIALERRDRLAWLERQGLIERQGARVRATRDGRRVLDAVVRELVQ